MEQIDSFLDNPFEQFLNWFKYAVDQGLDKPESFSLGTIGLDSYPKGRTVLFKGLHEDCFSFYTNYQSDKAKEIEASSLVSALFYWHRPLDLQVRIQGTARFAPKELSDAYFASRPRGSQIGAWASPQSKVISSRHELDQLTEEYTKKFANRDVPRPEFWGGFLIEPKSFEFMILRESRLHDRLKYLKEPGTLRWTKQTIAP